MPKRQGNSNAARRAGIFSPGLPCSSLGLCCTSCILPDTPALQLGHGASSYPHSSSPASQRAALPLVQFSKFSLTLRQTGLAPDLFVLNWADKTGEHHPVTASSPPIFSTALLIKSTKLTCTKALRARDTRQLEILPSVHWFYLP